MAALYGASGSLYQAPLKLTHGPRLDRHAGGGRYPRLRCSHTGKSWIPACAGMTRWASFEGRCPGRLVLDGKYARANGTEPATYRRGESAIAVGPLRLAVQCGLTLKSFGRTD